MNIPNIFTFEPWDRMWSLRSTFWNFHLGLRGFWCCQSRLCFLDNLLDQCLQFFRNGDIVRVIFGSVFRYRQMISVQSMPDFLRIAQGCRLHGDDHFSSRQPLESHCRFFKWLTHARRVFSVSKNEINSNERTRWTKPLLIASTASLFGWSCLTKLREEKDAARMRSSIPARSDPWWGVPKNTTASISLYSGEYSGLLNASMIAFR